MATLELRTLNAVLKNRDIATLFNAGAVNDLFVGYGDVWDFIKTHYSRYHTIPTIDTVKDECPSFEEVEVADHTKYYLDELRSEMTRNEIRRLITVASQKVDTVDPMQLKGQFISNLMKLNRFDGSSKDLNVMDFEKAEEHYAEVRQRALDNGGVPGIPTGIKFIDSAYPSGLAGGDLIIVLGWTGRGKSLLTTLISCNAHDKGRKPMIVSLEMSAEKIRDRVYTIKGSGLFRNTDLMMGDIQIDNFRQFKKEHADDNEFVVVRHDGVGELTPHYVQSKIDQHNPGILTIDYAQLASDNSNSQDMTARMRNMSKEYKAMAVMNDIPIILISSATPDSSASMDSPPIIEQVAWSKQLSYDADLAIAPHRHDGSNIIEVVGRKNRNGDLFAGYIDWEINTGQMEEKFEI